MKMQSIRKTTNHWNGEPNQRFKRKPGRILSDNVNHYRKKSKNIIAQTFNLSSSSLSSTLSSAQFDYWYRFRCRSCHPNHSLSTFTFYTTILVSIILVLNLNLVAINGQKTALDSDEYDDSNNNNNNDNVRLLNRHNYRNRTNSHTIGHHTVGAPYRQLSAAGSPPYSISDKFGTRNRPESAGTVIFMSNGHRVIGDNEEIDSDSEAGYLEPDKKPFKIVNGVIVRGDKFGANVSHLQPDIATVINYDDGNGGFNNNVDTFANAHHGNYHRGSANINRVHSDTISTGNNRINLEGFSRTGVSSNDYRANGGSGTRVNIGDLNRGANIDGALRHETGTIFYDNRNRIGTGHDAHYHRGSAAHQGGIINRTGILSEIGHGAHIDGSHGRFQTGSIARDHNHRFGSEHNVQGHRIFITDAENRTNLHAGAGHAIQRGHVHDHRIGLGHDDRYQGHVHVGAINRTRIYPEYAPGSGGRVYFGHQYGGVNVGSYIPTVYNTGAGPIIFRGTHNRLENGSRIYHHQDRFGHNVRLGHQDGSINRTIVHGGTGSLIHRDYINGTHVRLENGTIVHHHQIGSGQNVRFGHQNQVVPLNRTIIYVPVINQGHGRLETVNRTGVQLGHQDRVHVGALNRTGTQFGHRDHIDTVRVNDTRIHSGYAPIIHREHYNRTGIHTVPGHVLNLDRHQNRVNVSAINRTGIYSSTGATGGLNRTVIHPGHQDRINLGSINRTTASTGGIFGVANHTVGSGIHFDDRNVIDTRVRTRPEPEIEYITDHERVDTNIIDAPSSNIRAGTTGTAVQLNTLDNVDVEAINKARIWADQESEEQAKKHAQNVVRLAATDQLESEIITNRTRAYLSCESGEMIVKINFTKPFRGVGYADYDRTSPCKFYGDGGQYYEMRIPLKGCGTKQEAPRIFLNNIILRFHRSLELEEDEIKTIICRYPPPLAPPPPLIAAPILEAPPPAVPFIPAKLSEVELLLIVSALLFLTLLLLGIGIGYYCLKKRKVKVVRKFVPPEIPYFPPPSISSEEHSIISEGSVLQRDDYQFQNLGFIPETKLSYMDDMFYNDQDLIDEDVLVSQQNIIAPPMPQFSTKKIDDRFVTHSMETDVETDYEVDRLIVPKKPKITTLITDDYFVSPKTTTEIIDEVTTHRVIVPPKKPITTKYIDDTLITPKEDIEIDEETTKHKVFGPTKLTTQTVDDVYVHSDNETEIIDSVTKHRIYGPEQPPKITTSQKDQQYRTEYEINEIIDDTKSFTKYTPTTRVVQTTEDDEIITHSRDVEEFVDDTNYRIIHKGPPEPRKPKYTVQNIDDFYITNITETETNEQVTKIGRSMPNLTLQVDYEEQEQLEENYRHTGFDVKLRSIPRQPEQSKPITTTSTTKISEVLRILDNPPKDKIPNIDQYLILPARNRLRQIIMTDEVFRTLIIESTTIEEYTERIQRHPSYGPMFEPPTWEVIFRLLSLPEINKKPTKGKYDTYRSGVSSHEVRSVTEEDVTFSRRRMSGAHMVPKPDYPMEDDDEPKYNHWASRLPDPRHYESYSADFTPITPAFAGTRRPSNRRYYGENISPTSSVFGTRRLENPYSSASPASIRRRLFEYDIRPYSPDLDALSLEPSQTYLAYSGSIRRRNQQIQNEEREEIKSTTETNVYDWKRYN